MTLVISWRTTKLIEGGHRGVQAYRPICYYFYVFYVFYIFLKIQQNVTFYVFCRVSYVFSNYDGRTTTRRLSWAWLFITLYLLCHREEHSEQWLFRISILFMSASLPITTLFLHKLVRFRRHACNCQYVTMQVRIQYTELYRMTVLFVS